jgi:glucose 1-dehydrogenase
MADPWGPGFPSSTGFFLNRPSPASLRIQYLSSPTMFRQKKQANLAFQFNLYAMEKKLQGQVAIITGASSGIGAGVSKALAASGATVVVNHPVPATEAAADAVLAEIKKEGNQGITYMCDVSKEEEVKKMFDETISRFGTVDILVNNAGLQRDSPFSEMTLEQWNFVIGVNLTGQFLCAREAIREFLKRGVVAERSKAAGKIICMSSVHEVIPWAGHANYAASKGGIMLMMKSIAQEYAPHKIRINSIGPGAIKTPINREAWDTPQAEAKLLELIPYQRVGVVEDIGAAAVWLASDDSDYVNGITLFVDGGMTLYPGFSTNG